PGLMAVRADAVRLDRAAVGRLGAAFGQPLLELLDGRPLAGDGVPEAAATALALVIAGLTARAAAHGRGLCENGSDWNWCGISPPPTGARELSRSRRDAGEPAGHALLGLAQR